MARPARCDRAAYVWLALVLGSVIVLLALQAVGGAGLRQLGFWLAVVVLLGPIGLLARIVVRRGNLPTDGDTREPRAGESRQFWKHILVEAVGNLPPYVAAVVVVLLALTLMMSRGGLRSPYVGILMLWGVPLVVALILYQAPLLAGANGRGYFRTLLRQAPSALITNNLALAGLLAVCLPLVNWHLHVCPITEPLGLASWWAITAGGALVGAVLLIAYAGWSLRRGHATWSARLWDGSLSSPPWRELWPWILISFALLATGTWLGIQGMFLAPSILH
jgi:hypothetical protein